jgi:DNA replication licensing factor MCM6
LYRNLRQTDAFGTGHNAYRITVRQLESLIRLSEALARVHCEDLVHPKYVREAYRLLQKSIIHVEQDDVALDDAPIDPPRQPVEEETPPQRRVTRIDRDNFDKIQDALVYKIRSQEEDTELMTRSQLVDWYLDQQMEEFTTPEERNVGRRLVSKVIRYLCTKDEVLIELRTIQDMDDDAVEQDPIVTVHPNYVQD